MVRFDHRNLREGNMKPYKYRTAEQSRAPNYLRKRFAAIRRLQRMQAAKSNVQPLPRKVAK